MHIAILVLGTRGDVELLLTLARALCRRGHRITFGTSLFYAGAVTSSGVEHVSIGSGDQEELVAICRSLRSIRDRRWRVEAYYRQWVQPQLRIGSDQISYLVGQADYVVNNLKSVWKRRGATIPGAIITYDPPGSMENLAKYASRLEKNQRTILELVALNRQLIDPANQWGSAYHFTGFWRPESLNGSVPETVEEFVASGSPPVAITMGSMVAFDPEAFMETVVESLDRCGSRGVVVSSWAGLAAWRDYGDSVRVVPEVPYDWLFNRACCVVHHGGSSGVGAAIRAGRPSVLFPQITSQEHFATILMRERLATAAFDPDSVTATELSNAIRAATTETQFQRSAERWRKIIESDGGVELAADLIEQHAADVVR